MMRKLIPTIVVAALAAPGTAAAAELRLERLATLAESPMTASAEHKTTAYLSSRGALVVGSAGRGGLSVAIPEACTPVAAVDQAVAMTCTSPGGAQIIGTLDLSTRKLTPLQLPSSTQGRITAIGTRWASVAARSSPDDLHVVQTRLLIDWRTQRTISLGQDDPFGAREFIDLDAGMPGRRLCAPLTRIRENSVDNIKYVEISKQRSWTLTHDSLRGPLVQRCGQLVKRRLPRVSQPVLGMDFVGYVDGRRIVYLDLRTGKRRTRAWPTNQRPTLAAAGRRLIVSAPTQDGGAYRLYRSREP